MICGGKGVFNIEGTSRDNERGKCVPCAKNLPDRAEKGRAEACSA
jgi:hypothetical protein